jgi:lipopolysaccharide/colanic/teichoic acid biosynthesis glycosyltransferase
MSAASSSGAEVRGRARNGYAAAWHRGLKRALDVVGGGLLLVVVAPLLVCAALAVRLTSPGSAMFRQVRLGRDGRPFVMLKLRTMQDGCPDTEHRAYIQALLAGEATPVDGLYKVRSDTRVTRVGAVLRRTSMDELPQLWNVLCGHMSLVGPRPVLPYEAEMFPAWAHRRFEVRPGLTGLWQVSGRNRVTMLDGLALDVRYVERHGLLLDLAILLRTVGAVLGRGAR